MSSPQPKLAGGLSKPGARKGGNLKPTFSVETSDVSGSRLINERSPLASTDDLESDDDSSVNGLSHGPAGGMGGHGHGHGNDTASEDRSSSRIALAEDSATAQIGSDATKDFRRDINSGIKGIFEGLRTDLNKMEVRIKAAMVSSLEKDEMTFFAKQDEKELLRLRARQEQEIQREKRAFKTLMESREARQRGQVLQATMNFTAKNRDIIIQEQDKAQCIDAEVKAMLDDHRQAFEEYLQQVEARHTKKRKKLTAAFERKLQDKRTLFNLETAHLSPEMRQDRIKDFQFKVNHQKAEDKKVAEHRRDTQSLEIRQMKEMFDLQIKSLEETHTLKATKDREMMELQENQRREVQRSKEAIREVEFLVKAVKLQLEHNKHMRDVAIRHKSAIETVLSRQHQLRWARISKWKVVLKRETGLDVTFFNDPDPGVHLSTLFMDPQTTITRYLDIPNHRAINPDPKSPPIPLMPNILEGVNDEVDPIPHQILGEGESGYSNSPSSPISPSSLLTSNEKNDRVAQEEKDRLEQKLERMRLDVKELKEHHRAQLEAMRKQHADELGRLESTIRTRVNELREAQKTRAMQLKKQQDDELDQLHATQEKEAAMEENIRSAEHKMLMERKTLNSVLETVGDGIINIMPNGVLTRFNARAEIIFGYSSSEVLGRNVSMLQPENIDPMDKLATYLTSETYMLGVGRTVTGRKRDGTNFPLHLSISEVKENDMHLFTAIVRDLTEEVAAQEADRRETERKRQQMETLIQQLARERSRSSDLIHSMLPPTIAPRMLRGEVVPPESFDDATIMFTEIEGFSELTNTFTALDMVDLLDTLYCVFDEIILGYNVYKVETIGDSYVCVSGVPEPTADHASEIAKLALHFTRAITKIRIRSNPDLELKLKVGIHSGPVVAGVVGKKCSRYCLFGDTVNTSSRMKSTGEPSRIHMSAAAHTRLAAAKAGFHLERRGEVPVKGKGTMETFWLNGLDGFEPDLKIIDRMMESQRSLAAFANSTIVEPAGEEPLRRNDSAPNGGAGNGRPGMLTASKDIGAMGLGSGMVAPPSPSNGQAQTSPFRRAVMGGDRV
ncbi:hypothetical protein H9P43_009044 [Blastocladiella emersonii ATCC 22665]|nr:hypothetical protein H9P43_009044 [Blastocladiella emersonii ATCC 22665]